MRNKYKYPIISSSFIRKLLVSSEKYNYFSLLLSSKNNTDKYSKFETIAAFGAREVLKSDNNSFSELLQFQEKYNDWLFGYLSYDLKNELEDLQSENIDSQNLVNLDFFIPETIFFISESEVKIESYLSKIEVESLIKNIKKTKNSENKSSSVHLKFRETKAEYIDKINKIKNHIQFGDIYEMNYCQELYSEGIKINPPQVFENLHKKSNAPFSVFFKI